MKKRIGLLLKIIIMCIFLTLSTTGCWNRRELDSLAIVLGVGIDEAGEPGKIQLSAQIGKPGEMKSSQNEGGGGSTEAYLNTKNTGNTVFSIFRGFTHEFSRKLYFQHNQVLIFGRGIAEKGVQEYIDFFLRDHETRLTVWVLVAKDKAGEIFEAKPQLEKIPALDIVDTIQAQAATSQTTTVKLYQFITRLMSKTTAPVASLIEVTGEGKEKRALISGTAVFKKDKLAGQLDKTETRGLLWVLGEVKSGIVDVDCPGGDGKASLEIVKASSKITPEIKDGKIHIKVEITEEGNLGSQSCPENLALPPAMASLEKKKEAAIRSEVMAALEKARELNADIFGFGDAVHQKYPQLWKDLESRWEEIFPYLDVEVIVKVKLRGTGVTTKLPNPEKE